MGRLRALTGQSPAIAISLVALVLSLSGGAYAATEQSSSHSVSAAAAVSWHRLHLLNGWVSSQSVYGTGNPSYSVSGGTVYLSGSLHQPTSGSNKFAQLPSSARPAHNLYIEIYSFDGAPGSLLISKNGFMYLFNVSGTATKGYSSLAAVSYPRNS